jgi:hypothetical protein
VGLRRAPWPETGTATESETATESVTATGTATDTVTATATDTESESETVSGTGARPQFSAAAGEPPAGFVTQIELRPPAVAHLWLAQRLLQPAECASRSPWP